MTAPRRPLATRPGQVGAPLGVSLALVALLATVGSFGVGFGVMTGCTDDVSCTSTSCAPCDAAADWLAIGWIAQGVLLLLGVLLAVLVARGVRARWVRPAAWLLGPVSIALITLTTWSAMRGY